VKVTDAHQGASPPPKNYVSRLRLRLISRQDHCDFVSGWKVAAAGVNTRSNAELNRMVFRIVVSKLAENFVRVAEEIGIVVVFSHHSLEGLHGVTSESGVVLHPVV
jgi:hypothetical protein